MAGFGRLNNPLLPGDSVLLQEKYAGKRSGVPLSTFLDFSRENIPIIIMITIGIQDIRFDFARAKSALERGEELVLTYRNKPLAKITPFEGAADPAADPALEFGLVPERLEPMSNSEIDKAVYG